MAKSAHDKLISSIKRQRGRRLASLVTKSYYLHKRKQDEKMYSLVCEEFLSLGGVYVKFLQGVLLRSKIMRKWHNPEKLKIFENLDAEHIDIAALLRHELPKNRLSQIAQVQPEPFAAGSFGQVYYGQLRSGRPIIIKVLRPMVRELLNYDVKLLNRFARSFFSQVYKNTTVQMRDAIKEFTEVTMRETDYRHEAEFANELYQHYKGHPYLFVPETYLELCTDNIIVQDYVDGISVAQLIRMQEQGINAVDYVKEQLGSDLLRQMEELGYESIIGAFSLPRVQGDPHPGNIRVMRDNKVGLIDFGISAPTPKNKNNMYGLMRAFDGIYKGKDAVAFLEQGLKFFVGDLYKALKRLSEFMGGNGDDRDYVSEVTNIAGKMLVGNDGSSHFEADLKDDAGILASISKAVNKGNRFGLVISLEASELLRAIQTYTAMLSSLGLYRKVMVPMMDRAVIEIARANPEVTKDTSDKVSVGQAIETVSNWLERVAERDPLLFRELSEKMRMNDKPVLAAEGGEDD